MSYPVKYNQNSILLPADAGSPAGYFVDIDHMFTVGLTGDPSLAAKYVLRQESNTNGGTVSILTQTVAGHPGIANVAPGSGAGGRIQMESASFLTSATKPIIMEAYCTFVTGGTYFVGFTEPRATNATVGTSSGLTAGVQGSGVLIQTDDKADCVAIGGDGTVATILTDQYTFTAGTWYRIGVKQYPTVTECYVNGRLFSQITHTTLAADPMTPVAGCLGSGATKILSVDYIGTATELALS